MEILRPHPAPGRLRHAVFDFDGTLSLLRAGWPLVMADLMVEVLRATPGAGPASDARFRALTHEPIFGLAGQPTLVQMQWLAGEVRRRGGAPLAPEAYKLEYLVRLKERVHHLADLQAGRVSPARLLLPGALEFVAALAARRVTCHIASGTDESSVREEAAALGLAALVAEIRGARADGSDAKRVLIERLTAEQRLAPGELAAFGDGPVEMECARAAGGLAVGVASDEAAPGHLDEHKRARLIAAGADVIIPDFTQPAALFAYFWPAG